MIRVLIVEDSAVVSALLVAIINNEDDLEVIGQAKTGVEAIEMSVALNPDLITMDIRMPVMDGLTAIRKIMSTQPKPIVVISSNIDDELHISFTAIDEGALAVLEKPCGIQDVHFSSMQREITNTIRCMSEVKLIKRRIVQSPPIMVESVTKLEKDYKIVVIGSSTGGPQALKTILSGFPRNFSMPIVITQHISTGFVQGLTEWLNESCKLQVKIASEGERLEAGTVYFAPDAAHCMVKRLGEQYYIELCKEQGPDYFMPSVARLFESAADNCLGQAIGIILSGMGSDGAKGLLAMRQSQCLTIAQDEQSSIIFGMPKAAIELKAAMRILPVDDISPNLLTSKAATYS